MSENLRIDGASRIYPIIGDPISQVKSPAGMTAAFAARGVNAVVVPIHTSVDDVDDFIRTAGRTKNVDGIIVTIPHKFVALTHCSTATERARITGSINVLSRNPDGTWHGEIFDGLGMLGGIRSQGGEPSGKKTLLVGAGGAGIAIAQALLETGVRELAIHDVDINRRDHVITRMREFYGGRVHAGLTTQLDSSSWSTRPRWGWALNTPSPFRSSDCRETHLSPASSLLPLFRHG
ncbi:shikimate dehydrogenase family protein [Sinorhizobium psoraleae]|uniref:shikimate dehydrogenase family protein n=1 Tax=Sinorhizobium psoraleae TaxID=520838 RepID=UPI00289F4A0D|nr:hypothetical protein [Sinorhizobium psoraleae]